jgi:hypothetical protein
LLLRLRGLLRLLLTRCELATVATRLVGGRFEIETLGFGFSGAGCGPAWRPAWRGLQRLGAFGGGLSPA